MSRILTTAADIQCGHNGKVSVTPSSQSFVTVDGEAVLTAADFLGNIRPVRDCVTPDSSKTFPCRSTTGQAVPSTSPLFVTINGVPVCDKTLSGTTLGSPPGKLNIVDPGNNVVSLV